MLTGFLWSNRPSVLTHDERYKRKVQGLQATIITLARCHSFLETGNVCLWYLRIL